MTTATLTLSDVVRLARKIRAADARMARTRGQNATPADLCGHCMHCGYVVPVNRTRTCYSGARSHGRIVRHCETYA